jgi:hypothetical protein
MLQFSERKLMSDQYYPTSGAKLVCIFCFGQKNAFERALKPNTVASGNKKKTVELLSLRAF